MTMSIISTNDNKFFNIDDNIASTISLIKRTEEIYNNDPIQLSEVCGDDFERIIKYCKFHMDVLSPERIKEWETALFDIDNSELFRLLRAANYLGADNIINSIITNIYDKIHNMSSEQMHTFVLYI